MTDGDSQFVDKVRASLDQRLEHTSVDVASRLRAARLLALDSREGRKRQAWLPAMATATLAAVVVITVWFGQRPVSERAPQPMVVAGLEQTADDFDMLTGNDDLALYAEMDFYLWLDKRGLDAG
jgi:hypothetical protein